MGVEQIADGVIEKDVLVVGTEAAGAVAAITASEGADVLMVTKAVMAKSGVTIMAVATYTAPLDQRDDPATALKDAIIGGRFLNDQHLCKIFTEEAADTVRLLEGFGVRWAKDGERYKQLHMPGHSYDRGCYTQPIGTTGRQITRALAKERERRKVQLLNDTLVTDILVQNGRAVGATAIDLRTGQFLVIKAKCVVLATGGGMELYKGNCASREATGDGYAMAYRLGLPLRDMEFVQYFPTVMVWPKRLFGQQTPTRLRYELNAQLLNFFGERFMRRYDPVRMERSTRDIVARAIQTEVREGRGTEHGGVYLDVSYLPPKVIDAAIERLYPGYDFGGVKLLDEGIDIRQEPFEVAPGAHFFMGGVVADEWGEVGLPGLLACGEVVGGVHGANRLGGNALPDMSVFGRRAGIRAAELAAAQKGFVEPSDAQVGQIRQRLEAIRTREPGVRPLDVRNEIQQIMADNVLAHRDASTLNTAINRLTAIRAEKLPRLGLTTATRCYNLEWMVALEAEFMVDVAELIARSALARTESRGAHFRADFPTEDNDNWLKSLFVRQEGGAVRLEARPAVLAYVTLDQDTAGQEGTK